MIRAYLLAAMLLALWAGGARGAETLRLIYADLPGLIVTGKDGPKGPVVDLAHGVEGVTIAWEGPHDWAHVMGLLSRASVPVCTPFAALTVDRRSRLRVSSPYLPGQLLQVIVRADDRRFDQYTSFREVLSDRRLTIGLSRGSSLGTANDRLVAALDPPSIVMKGTWPRLRTMFEAGRIDYAVRNAESVFSTSPAEERARYRALSFPDLAPHEPVGFVCSAYTPDWMIERINAAISRTDVTAIRDVFDGREAGG